MRDSRILLAVLVSVLLLLLVACGGTSTSEPVSAATASPSDTLRVGLTEWTIVTSTAEVLPGRVTLTVTNTGATEHDLYVAGDAGQWETPDLRPGERDELTVTARPGERLHLWCDVPGHRAQGMHTELEVADG